jgi:putative PIN family toxin of toxin-antitoxin system
MRVVLDTNVVFSALIWRKGWTRKAWDLAREKQIDFITSQILFDELVDLLTRPKTEKILKKVELTAEMIIEGFRQSVIIVESATIPRIVDDPDDDHVLACAVGGNADFIVTGDDDLLRLEIFQNIPIITVSAWFDQLNIEESS